MERYILSHLKRLEAESLHILRETAAEFENPVMLYSIGKDSSVMLRLAQKAFYPGRLPFPLLHVDTGLKFPEMVRFRDEYVRQIGARLKVYQYREYLDKNVNNGVFDCDTCCSFLKTQALLNALREGGHDAALGGARRDEEKSRAKERVFSYRDAGGVWDPKNQRPELWNVYNPRVRKGDSIRVFPLSNWTEVDVWQYIWQEKIPVVPLYFAEKRRVVRRGGVLIRIADIVAPRADETVEEIWCRFRSLGCEPCTGAIPSRARTVEEILAETIRASKSERENRVIDHGSESSMEQKKKEGYF